MIHSQATGGDKYLGTSAGWQKDLRSGENFSLGKKWGKEAPKGVTMLWTVLKNAKFLRSAIIRVSRTFSVLSAFETENGKKH